MISGALCRGMSGTPPGTPPLSGAAGSPLSPTASSVSLGSLAATASSGSIQPDPLDALVKKVLQLVEKVNAEITAPLAAAPTAPAPSKALEKVELFTITDPSNNPIITSRQNNRFTIVDVSGNNLGDIDSPLLLFEKYLDITQLTKKDINIIRGIISTASTKSGRVDPLLKIKALLPDNIYTKPIIKALDLYVEFHNEILSKSTEQNLITAKKNATRWYQHIPFKYIVDEDIARKSLELLFSEALSKAVEAHDLLVSSAEDYFNMHIVYNRPGVLISGALDEKSAKQDIACKDICSNILGAIDTYTAIKTSIKNTYVPDVSTYLSIQKDTVHRLHADTIQTIKSKAREFNDLSLNVSKVIAFNSNPTPSLSEKTAAETIFEDISTNYNSKYDEYESYKTALTTIINKFDSINSVKNKFERDLILFHNNAHRSLIIKIAGEYAIVKSMLDDISNGVSQLIQEYDPMISLVTKAQTDLDALKTNASITNGLSAYDREQARISQQQLIDISNTPALGNWHQMYDNKVVIDASFNALLPDLSDNAYINLKDAKNRLDKSFKTSSDAKDKYEATDLFINLGANLLNFTNTIPGLQANFTSYNTAYTSYYSTSITASTLRTGVIAARAQYLGKFIENMLLDISSTFFNENANGHGILVAGLAQEGTLLGVDISSNPVNKEMLEKTATVTITNLIQDLTQPTDAEIIARLETYHPDTAVADPLEDSPLRGFITDYTTRNPLTMLRGGSRYRVTRRRRTGSKRLRKTRARK